MSFKKKKVKRVSDPNLLPPPFIWDVFDFLPGYKVLVTEIEADSKDQAERIYANSKNSGRYLLVGKDRTEFQVNLKKTKEKLEAIEKEKQTRIQNMWYNQD